MALTDVKSEQIQSSVALAGSPTTTTQSASDNSTKIATTAYVETAVANLVASAPSALNTLDELAAALNDDASFSTTITNSIATKLPLAGGTLTGAIVVDVGAPSATDQTLSTFQSQSSRQIGFVWDDSASTLGVATLTSHPLVFHTGGNSSEKMRIDTSGNVGIGASPAFGSGSGLEVSRSGTATVRVERTGSTASSGEFFAGNGKVVLSSISNNHLEFRTNNTEVVRIDANGNVGIGQPSPEGLLHIEKGSSGVTYTPDSADQVIIENSDSMAIDIRTPANKTGVIMFSDPDARARGLIQYAHASDTMFINTGGANTVTIDSSGNVGIGTSSPDTFLDIEHTTNTHLQGIHITNKQTGGYGSAIRFNSRRSDGGQSTEEAAQIRVEGANSWNSNGTTASNLLFSTVHNNTLAERMRIASTGNVGINHSTPPYPLTVVGEAYVEGLNNKGFSSLGENADGQTDVTTLQGYGILSGSTRYGKYGVLRFNSSANYTGSSRGYMITNGYGANQFAILQSTSATTMPDIASAGGGASNGHPIFISNNAGHITLPKQPSSIRRVTGGGLTNVNCNGAYYQLYFGVNWRDEGSMHSQISGGGSKFTAPVAGVYFYSCQIRVDAFSGNYFYMDARVNGTTRNRDLSSNTGSYLSYHVVGTYYLGAGDYFTFEVANSNDNSVNIDDASYVSIYLVG